MNGADTIVAIIDAAQPVVSAAAAAVVENPQPSQTGASRPKQDQRRGAGRGATARRRRPADDGRFAPGDPAALDRELAFYPQTDLGNAERFCARYRGRLLHCGAIGWLAWDGRRWARDEGEDQVRLAAHATVRAIQREAATLADADARARLAAWGKKSEAAARIAALADNARPYLAVGAGELDADPYAINVNNGTLRLRGAAAPEIELHPHDPADLITKLAPVDYDPEAACPAYDEFLEFVQPDPHMRRFLHQWGGYSLTGDTGEQIFTFHWGLGKNGKTTLFNAWAHVAGDYGRTIQIESFLDSGRARAGGAPTPDLAMLKGVRYLRTGEPERGAKLAEALVKLATGGEVMTVRHLNREFFELRPQFKLTMSGNYQPQIAGADEGIWRRVRLVPWTVEIPPAQRLRDFDRRRLYPEASGILNRLLAGLIDWREHGLVEPERVREATATYRSDSDPLGRFLAACTEAEAGARVQASLLHALFVAWARANGEREWSATGLGRAMRQRGYRSMHSDVNWWLDLRAVRAVADFVDHEGRPRAAAAEAPP